ncbi:MAG: CRTAC1 family protein [Limisphaerales bacterium]
MTFSRGAFFKAFRHASIRLCWGLALLISGPLSAAPPIRFRDATATSGIQFVHSDGSSGKRYIIETVASGLGLIDYNGDGWPDIYFLNGAPLPGTPPPQQPTMNALYRNNRDGTFTDVTAQSGTGVSGYCLACAVADYDNDGYEDIFITGYGQNWLLHNNGNGTFTDVTEKAGLAHSSFPGCVGAGCAFLDYDRDGHLDLYVGHYLNFNEGTRKAWTLKNVPAYCNPRSFPPVASQLYHNNGDGTFTDASASTGIGRYKGYAMGVVCSDFDNDGWPDIFVGNDVMENFLFHNKRDGTFEEIGLPSGVAYNEYGESLGTMGANVGDYDGDGLPDLLLTDYQGKLNTLYRNLGNMRFQDVTLRTGAGLGSFSLVKWGCGLVDFDNDGVPEIFTAAGHLQDTVEQFDRSTTYKERSLLLQQRAGRFVDVTAGSGAIAATVESSRGAVFGDLNNDGKIDIVLLNARTRPTLLINETATTNHWVLLKLIGSKSNRSAVGAVARVTAGGRTQADEVRSGRGYQSAEDLRLHFGLASAAVIDRLEVRWPSGATNVWTNLTADRVLQLSENGIAPASH